MFLSALSSALHYTLHSIDRQSEDPWENKTIYIRIINIFIGTIINCQMTKVCPHWFPPGSDVEKKFILIYCD